MYVMLLMGGGLFISSPRSVSVIDISWITPRSNLYLYERFSADITIDLSLQWQLYSFWQHDSVGAFGDALPQKNVSVCSQFGYDGISDHQLKRGIPDFLPILVM